MKQKQLYMLNALLLCNFYLQSNQSEELSKPTITATMLITINSNGTTTIEGNVEQKNQNTSDTTQNVFKPVAHHQNSSPQARKYSPLKRPDSPIVSPSTFALNRTEDRSNSASKRSSDASPALQSEKAPSLKSIPEEPHNKGLEERNNYDQGKNDSYKKINRKIVRIERPESYGTFAADSRNYLKNQTQKGCHKCLSGNKNCTKE